MIRRPREPEPDPITSEIGHILAPLVIFPWGPLAMNYLGVPIVLGVSCVVTNSDILPHANQFF
jgi:hypothetical protein